MAEPGASVLLTRCDEQPDVQLSLALWDATGSRWINLRIEQVQDRWIAVHPLGRVVVALTRRSGGWDYLLQLDATQPTRARLQLAPVTSESPYHLMPGVCHGDNSLAHDPAGRYPHLAAAGPQPAVSPTWEFRADRCAYPLSLLLLSNALCAVSIDPYSDEVKGPGLADGSVCNGVAATVAGADQPAACAVTLGYRNLPAGYLCQRRFEQPVGQLLTQGTARGRIYASACSSALDIHTVIRAEHQRLAPFRHRSSTLVHGGRGETKQAVEALRWGLGEVGWDSQREVFANMAWDHDRQAFCDSSAHGFHEIAWTAGTVAACPLLLNGLAVDDHRAVRRARLIFDRVARAVSPASGLFHDAVDRHGQPVQGWWAFYGLVPWEHYAYLNGQAATYMLHAWEADLNAPRRADWLSATVAVLQRVIALQRPDGSLPWCFSRQDGRALDYDGFAACWFVPALALACRITGNQGFLRAAENAFARYSQDVKAVHCYGTPLDTFKAVDSEGILAFIRAAHLLHETTGDDGYLDWLGHGLAYEYLWRYGYATRPPAEPLRSANWSSVGGSITSVANPHAHPMSLLCMGDALYYMDHCDDAYHRRRLTEQRDWALQCLALYPTHAGFGHYGTMSERMCPSDGLVIEQHPDGRPWALWFTHHVWAAANVLEGLLALVEKELVCQ